MRFAVIGGDRRAVHLCSLLTRDGHKVYTYALDNAELPKNVPRSGCLQGCVYGADCVVLPVPAENSGFINAPFAIEPLETERLADALWKGQLVCGGGLSGALRAAALAAGASAEDILARADFAVMNAALTAEGAIGLLIGESEKSLLASRVLVLGYGRIGRVLTRELTALGALVTVAERSSAGRAEAELLGADVTDISGLDDAGGYDYIVNTVPARVLNEKVLCTLRETLLLELASAPGGFDRQLAENIGIRVLTAPGLPGRTMPYAAAKLLRRAVYDIIREQGDGK